MAIQCSPEQLQPFAAPIVERLVPILAAPMSQMPRSIVENRSALSSALFIKRTHIAVCLGLGILGSGAGKYIFHIVLSPTSSGIWFGAVWVGCGEQARSLGTQHSTVAPLDSSWSLAPFLAAGVNLSCCVTVTVPLQTAWASARPHVYNAESISNSGYGKAFCAQHNK